MDNFVENPQNNRFKASICAGLNTLVKKQAKVKRLKNNSLGSRFGLYRLLCFLNRRKALAVDRAPCPMPVAAHFHAPFSVAQPVLNMSFSAPMPPDLSSAAWPVGTLVRAVADTLAARFNPVRVVGEVSSFTRAGSGHCYFSLKDDDAQLRCAMFRRAAETLARLPADGERVEVTGRLDLYGPRGDLQLIVEKLVPAGQGALLERFLRLKAKLEAEGLFDDDRKRPLPPVPVSIGVVTSLGAAALRDVSSTLQRRVPHIPVSVFPATVQGAGAPAELCAALEAAYQCHAQTGHPQVLLLVRGGGSLEDLWAFNDEQLVRTLARAPMPVVSGVGHQTDFTLADFVADLRAPTPTAAAELCATDRATLLNVVQAFEQQLLRATEDALDQRAQRLDQLAQRLRQPSELLARQRLRLETLAQSLQHAVHLKAEQKVQYLKALEPVFVDKIQRHLEGQHHRLDRLGVALAAMDPALVLQRGYAWLSGPDGQAVTRAAQTAPGQALVAHLADGEVDLRVL